MKTQLHNEKTHNFNQTKNRALFKNSHNLLRKSNQNFNLDIKWHWWQCFSFAPKYTVNIWLISWFSENLHIFKVQQDSLAKWVDDQRSSMFKICAARLKLSLTHYTLRVWTGSLPLDPKQGEGIHLPWTHAYRGLY